MPSRLREAKCSLQILSFRLLLFGKTLHFSSDWNGDGVKKNLISNVDYIRQIIGFHAKVCVEFVLQMGRKQSICNFCQ